MVIELGPRLEHTIETVPTGERTDMHEVAPFRVEAQLPAALGLVQRRALIGSLPLPMATTGTSGARDYGHSCAAAR